MFPNNIKLFYFRKPVNNFNLKTRILEVIHPSQWCSMGTEANVKFWTADEVYTRTYAHIVQLLWSTQQSLTGFCAYSLFASAFNKQYDGFKQYYNDKAILSCSGVQNEAL